MPNRIDILLSVESARPGSFTKEISEMKSQSQLIDTEKHRRAPKSARVEGEIPVKRSLGKEKKIRSKTRAT